MFTNLPERILINEVVTRDGFQSEPDFVSTATKIDLINALAGLGLNKIEAAFESPIVSLERHVRTNNGSGLSARLRGCSVNGETTIYD